MSTTQPFITWQKLETEIIRLLCVLFCFLLHQPRNGVEKKEEKKKRRKEGGRKGGTEEQREGGKEGRA